MTTDTAEVIPINKVREPACSHLRNGLQIVQNFNDEIMQMSEQSIAHHAPADICDIRDRIQAALEIIEEVKASLKDSRTMTESGKSVAIARIRSLL